MILYSHSWIYLKKTLIWKDVCTPVFITAVFTILKTWKQLKYPSTDKWIKKLWCIYLQWNVVIVFQSLSHVWLFVTPWTAAHQASLSFTISPSLFKLMSIKSVIPSNHLILCRPLLLPHSIFPSIRVFSSESALPIRWPEYREASASVLPVNAKSLQSCPTLCEPMDFGTPGLPVHHQLPEPTQTHVHPVGDTIQPSHPLLSPSPPALNRSQHQGLFQWVDSLHQVARVLELHSPSNEYSGLLSFRID